ncbi:MAG: hypothetical protein LBH59_04315, partial [Planctomycetaceae bacterium]|nr:hypothetical protein [Planctomycetaceae bacterium]
NENEKNDTPTMMENRYLFINAEFDESIIPPADIQQLPEIPTEGDQVEIDKIKKEREAKEKSNLREQERVSKSIESGKSRVKKLSARFSDWYYVISEDVYKKIHLTESSIIRPKTPSPTDPHQHPTTPPKEQNNSLPEINLPGVNGAFELPKENQ